MKTLIKFFSILILGLVILFFINCKDFKNPMGPDPDPEPPVPPVSEITVDYNGSPVTGTLNSWQITLNWVKVEEKLKDYTQDKWFYPYFRWFIVIEVKAKCVVVVGGQPSIGIVTNLFTLIDRNNTLYWPRTTIACSCFYNALMYDDLKPGEESPPRILVFDVPDPRNGLVLIFANNPNPELVKIRIKFRLNL
jgi:hypothetical protein